MTSIAHAAGPVVDTGAAGGGFGNFIPLILIFVVFYFLLIRPQQQQAKAHRDFLAELKRGNKVVTKGGIHGEITGLTDTVVTLEIAKDIRIKVSRDSIGSGLDRDGKAKELVKGGGSRSG